MGFDVFLKFDVSNTLSIDVGTLENWLNLIGKYSEARRWRDAKFQLGAARSSRRSEESRLAVETAGGAGSLSNTGKRSRLLSSLRENLGRLTRLGALSAANFLLPVPVKRLVRGDLCQARAVSDRREIRWNRPSSWRPTVINSTELGIAV